jgi:hypothetical protein
VWKATPLPRRYLSPRTTSGRRKKDPPKTKKEKKEDRRNQAKGRRRSRTRSYNVSEKIEKEDSVDDKASKPKIP